MIHFMEIIVENVLAYTIIVNEMRTSKNLKAEIR